MIIFNNGRSDGDGGLRAQTLEQIKDEAKHSLRVKHESLTTCSLGWVTRFRLTCKMGWRLSLSYWVVLMVSIHYKHVTQCRRVRTQSVIIMITALWVRFYYVVENNDEGDSSISRGKTHGPECLSTAPEEAQVRSSLGISSWSALPLRSNSSGNH